MELILVLCVLAALDIAATTVGSDTSAVATFERIEGPNRSRREWDR